VGAIVGGAVGGVIAIVAVGLIIFLLIQIKRRRSHTESDMRATPHLLALDSPDMENAQEQQLFATTPRQPAEAISVSAAPPPTHLNDSARPTASSSVHPNPQARERNVFPSSSAHISSPIAAEAAPVAPTRMVPARPGSISSGVAKESTTPEPSFSDTLARVPTPPIAALPNNLLTDEQIKFVRTLWAANVPPTDIAHMIERMKVENGAAESVSRGGINNANSGQEPPRYDFVST
jgi:hypothetical protein